MRQFFKPFKLVKCVVIGKKARVSFLMIEEGSPFFDRGVKKQKKVQGCVITYLFEKKDWNIVRIRYNITLKAPLESSAFIAVGALITATAAATAATATAAATPTPTPVATSTSATATIEAAPIATPTPTPTPPTTTPSPPPPPPPTTPKCYIVCTCDEPDCNLKQDWLPQHKHKRSSATLCAPYIKRKWD